MALDTDQYGTVEDHLGYAIDEESNPDMVSFADRSLIKAQVIALDRIATALEDLVKLGKLDRGMST